MNCYFFAKRLLWRVVKKELPRFWLTAYPSSPNGTLPEFARTFRHENLQDLQLRLDRAFHSSTAIWGGHLLAQEDVPNDPGVSDSQEPFQVCRILVKRIGLRQHVVIVTATNRKSKREMAA